MTEKLLMETLDAFARDGQIADFWLRDDDATQPTALLARLLDLSERFSVPMTLAVIPEPTGEALAKYLAGNARIDVAVHGWAHRNHATPDEKKRELGLHRPKEIVVGELKAGYDKLAQLYDSRFVSMLVPPWNRIDAEIVEALPGLGYRALSVYGPETSGPMPRINTHIDVIDWRGTRGGRNHDVLFAETAARMRQAHQTGGTVGILTHHLDHDEAVWSFLQKLFVLTASHSGCRWRASSELVKNLSP